MKTFRHQLLHELKQARWFLLLFLFWQLLWAVTWISGAAWQAPVTPLIRAAEWIEAIYHPVSILILIPCVSSLFLHDTPRPLTAFVTTRPIGRRTHVVAKLLIASITGIIVPSCFAALSRSISGDPLSQWWNTFWFFVPRFSFWVIILATCCLIGGTWRGFGILFSVLLVAHSFPALLTHGQRFFKGETVGPSDFFGICLQLLSSNTSGFFTSLLFCCLVAAMRIHLKSNRPNPLAPVALGIFVTGVIASTAYFSRSDISIPPWVNLEPAATAAISNEPMQPQDRPPWLERDWTRKSPSASSLTSPVMVWTTTKSGESSKVFKEMRHEFVAPHNASDPNDLSLLFQNALNSPQSPFRRIVQSTNHNYIGFSIRGGNTSNLEIIRTRPSILQVLPLKQGARILNGSNRMLISQCNIQEVDGTIGLDISIKSSDAFAPQDQFSEWFVVNAAEGYWIATEKYLKGITAAWPIKSTGSIFGKDLTLVQVQLTPLSKSVIDIQ